MPCSCVEARQRDLPASSAKLSSSEHFSNNSTVKSHHRGLETPTSQPSDTAAETSEYNKTTPWFALADTTADGNGAMPPPTSTHISREPVAKNLERSVTSTDLYLAGGGSAEPSSIRSISSHIAGVQRPSSVPRTSALAPTTLRANQPCFVRDAAAQVDPPQNNQHYRTPDRADENDDDDEDEYHELDDTIAYDVLRRSWLPEHLQEPTTPARPAAQIQQQHSAQPPAQSITPYHSPPPQPQIIHIQLSSPRANNANESLHLLSTKTSINPYMSKLHSIAFTTGGEHDSADAGQQLTGLMFKQISMVAQLENGGGSRAVSRTTTPRFMSLAKKRRQATTPNVSSPTSRLDFTTDEDVSYANGFRNLGQINEVRTAGGQVYGNNALF